MLSHGRDADCGFSNRHEAAINLVFGKEWCHIQHIKWPQSCLVRTMNRQEPWMRIEGMLEYHLSLGRDIPQAYLRW